MKKRTWLFGIVALLVLTASVSVPVSASTKQAEKGKSVGKQNFEQWQTIKRLRVITPIEQK